MRITDTRTYRFYLEQLRLLVVPRLAAVLTVVVMLMALISIFSHKLDLERGLSVALFPMVIISMVIERMSIVWEERGAGTAIREGFGSLALAALTLYRGPGDLRGRLLGIFLFLLAIELSLPDVVIGEPGRPRAALAVAEVWIGIDLRHLVDDDRIERGGDWRPLHDGRHRPEDFRGLRYTRAPSSHN